MSNQPLAIKGLGMISCLGIGAEANAAAMRCGYDGFQETSFMQPYHAEPQLGAMIELADAQLRGIPKLAHMGQVVINEATQGVSLDNADELQLLLCLPDTQAQPSYLYGNNLHNELLNQIKAGTPFEQFHPSSRAYWDSRCGFTQALLNAQQSLYQDAIKYVLIIGIDSLLNSSILGQYGGDLYGEGRRLLGEGHSNGFIPGEAATAVLLSRPEASDDVLITGVGAGTETATLSNDDEVLMGKGLAHAITQASEQAGVAIHDTAYRVASVSGEDYFFSEAALAQIKTLKQKVPDHPLWHPADAIGEVGSAVGGAMTIMTYYALTKGYAPGNNVLCHLSNDDEQRGAFIMQQEPPHGQ